jgi:predicted amidohydrolase YtcJ
VTRRGVSSPLLLAVALSMLVPAPSTRAQEFADLVVLNGDIYTGDPDRPRVEALAVHDGIVVALGDSRSITERHRGPETEVLDLQGKAAIPGLIDAHAHLENLGTFLRTVDLVGTRSPDEVAERVHAATSNRPPGEWILGRGWDQNDWSRKEFPEADILDRAAPDHPVYLERVDGHAIWVNTKALALAGVDASTPDPRGGRILRRLDGRPTGVLIDEAEDLIEPLVEPDAAEVEARLAAAQDHVLAVGLTGIHDMGTQHQEVEVLARMAREGRLAPRVAVYLDGDDRELTETWGARSEDDREEGGRLRVVGVKLYADGALGSRGAALLEPYSDDPGNTGLLLTIPDSLRALVTRALGVGLQPAIHAIGDRGNRVALDAIEAGLTVTRNEGDCIIVGAAGGGGIATCPGVAADSRPRIEHAQVIALVDIPRFAELGVVASVQPTHATSDMYWAEDRVGPERIEGAYAWRKLRGAGARLACGSDFPVENANPFHGLYAAVTRRDQEGWPDGGWHPEERMTREEALACFTIDAARAASMDDEVGSLAPGKRADFVVLDRDYFGVPEEEIWRIRVLRTVIDGETVFQAQATPLGP